jgi:hypothetical protein
MNEIVKRTAKRKREKKRERGTFTLIHLLHTHGGEKKKCKENHIYPLFCFTHRHTYIILS